MRRTANWCESICNSRIMRVGSATLICMASRRNSGMQWKKHGRSMRTPKKLCSLPSYLGMRPAPNDDQVEEGKAWRRLYEADLQDVMLRRQHHMHMPDAQGHRKPLGACKRKDNKDECRHGFPKFHEITEQALVVCPEMAARMRMPVAGRRSAVGSLHGALNHEYLNGCIPAISVGARDNNDIKLPYRFPITAGSHSSLCSANCVDSTRLSDMVQAIEASQDTTIGYCFDYATKRQPVGVYECREWMKGHKKKWHRGG